MSRWERSILTTTLNLCALLVAGYLDSALAQNANAPVWPTKEWLVSTPEAQGMDSAALAKLVAYGDGHRFDSLLIVRHGRIVVEASYALYPGNTPHEIFSATKAITGTLLAMVYKDGLLDGFDHPVLDFFSDRTIANIDDRKRAITIQNLLDMTSGFSWDQGFEGGKQQTMQDMYRASNQIQFILDRPMAYPPGEVFNYSNGNPNLISAIITRLTGKPAEDYAREKLFTPLGITDWHWDRDPQGLTIGDGMLFLLPRDMAKIGYLYLHHGEWEGRQLLPSGWADVLSHRTVNTHASYDPRMSYSDFFWILPDEHVYIASGKNGQDIAIFPDLDIIAVTAARKYVSFRALANYVASAVKSDVALPPNPGGEEQLASAVRDAATEKPTPVGPTPDIASALSGKTYKFPANEPGLKSVTLFLADQHPHIEYELYLANPAGASIKHSQPIGLNGLYSKGLSTLSDPYPGSISAAKGMWKDAATFEFDIQNIGRGTQIKYSLSFNGNELSFRRTDDEGWVFSATGKRDD